VICAQFVFRPGRYDDEFHRLDAAIGAYARSLAGFVRTESWQSADGTVHNAIYYFEDRESLAMLARYPQHREAQGQVSRWYEAHRVVVSEVSAVYGDEALLP
jgi:hypothetical protein